MQSNDYISVPLLTRGPFCVSKQIFVRPKPQKNASLLEYIIFYTTRLHIIKTPDSAEVVMSVGGDEGAEFKHTYWAIFLYCFEHSSVLAEILV